MTDTESNIEHATSHPVPMCVVGRYGFSEDDAVRDVGHEESRVYVGDDGDCILIEKQITLAVGEEGEHVFGLRNGCTVIVPPTFRLDAIYLVD